MHDLAVVVAVIGLVIFLAHIFSALSERVRVPDVLFLVITGVVLGPVSGLVDVDSLKAVAPVFLAIALIVVMFEAGLGLKVASLRSVARSTLVMTIVTFVVTAALITVVTRLVSGLDITLCLLVGVALGATSPFVIEAVARRLNLKMNGLSIIVFESTLSDAIAGVVFIVILEAYLTGQMDFGLMIGKGLASFVLALVIGAAGAFIWSLLIRRLRAFHSLFTTIAFVLLIFAVSEYLGYNGAIACLAFGITLGSLPSLRLRFFQDRDESPDGPNSLERFAFSEIAFLLRALVFMFVGVSIQFSGWLPVLLGMGLTFMAYIVRIPIVRFTLDRELTQRDASILTIMIPKGLAAAVLAAIPAQQGIAGADVLQNIAFWSILFSSAFSCGLMYLVDHPAAARLYRRVLPGFNRV
jgi:NhaP-type Na+/H+ or K+/H+ antiporter